MFVVVEEKESGQVVFWERQHAVREGDEERGSIGVGRAWNKSVAVYTECGAAQGASKVTRKSSRER